VIAALQRTTHASVLPSNEEDEMKQQDLRLISTTTQSDDWGPQVHYAGQLLMLERADDVYRMNLPTERDRSH